MTTIKINSNDIDVEDLTVIVNNTEFSFFPRQNGKTNSFLGLNEDWDDLEDEDAGVDYEEDEEYFEPEEVWRPIDGTAGLYEVSNLGNVKSYVKNRDGKLLVPHDDCRGYLIVRIKYQSGEAKMRKVSRLVLETFRPLPMYKRESREYQVDHVNGDKYDNRLCNLEWVTRTENIKRAGNLVPKRVICMETGMVFDSIGEAARFYGVDGKTISNACRPDRDRQWRGITLRYLDEIDD